ncbi:MAG: response regulator [Pseudomonadota bacterium]
MNRTRAGGPLDRLGTISEYLRGTMGRKKSILVVERDPETARRLFVGLVKAGHSVTETASAESAMEILKERSFHVAIVDVSTSRAKSAAILQALRDDWSHPSIIVTSDFQSSAVENAVRARGVNHFLVKPFQIERLLEIIAPPSVFSGKVEGVDILEYLQFMLLTGKKTIVEITDGSGRTCRLYLDDGDVVHAVIGRMEGEAAFFESLNFDGGQFCNLPWHDPERRSIHKRGDRLLLESAGRRDES